MKQIDFDDVGKIISWGDSMFSYSHTHSAKVVMVIKGASGRQLTLFEASSNEARDKQSLVIKDFMEVEAEWLKSQV